MKMLELKNIGFKYQLAKQPVFQKIDLDIEKGQFVGLVGKNGVGKTTLCNIIRGIIPNFTHGEMRGEVLIEGKNLKDYSMGLLAEKIGFVFQNPFIQISGIKKTVYEEIAFSLENIGVERSEIIRRVDAILKQFKIEYLKDQHPSQLSGGQSQRVALASVLVMEPDLLIVDEPTSQLDPIGTEEVFEALGILKQQQKTVILVEHKIDLISEYADRVIVMADEKIVMDGPTAEILGNKEIEKYGVLMPKVADLAYRIQDKKNVTFDKIPTNISDAEEVFRKEFDIHE